MGHSVLVLKLQVVSSISNKILATLLGMNRHCSITCIVAVVTLGLSMLVNHYAT